jgi:transposase InsO family protein
MPKWKAFGPRSRPKVPPVTTSHGHERSGGTRQSIFEFIEVWYNRQRRRSALGYASPQTFEKSHFESIRASSKSVLRHFG